MTTALKFALLLILTISCPFLTLAESGQCSHIFRTDVASFLFEKSTSSEVQKALAEAFISIESNIDMAKARGRETPKWHDFDNIEKSISFIQKVILLAKDSAREQEIHAFYRELNNVWSQQTRQQQFEPQKTIHRRTKKYGPIDYGMRMAYQIKLQNLNKYLPSHARFPFLEITPDTNKETINELARQTVTSVKRVHDHLMKKQGFESHEALLKEVRKSENGVKAIESLNSDKFQFAMYRPESSRFWVPKVGFQNQYVTGSSGGSLNYSARQATESTYTSTSKEQYVKQDLDLMPKYGFLYEKGTQLISARINKGYGSDIYFFKKDQIQDRTSFTLGDSLNGIAKSPFVDSIRNGISEKPVQWDYNFTPWSRREVLAPFIAKDFLEPGLHGIEAISAKSVEVSEDKRITRTHNQNEYIEMQYWGHVNLSNVESFAFINEAPTGEFLKALRNFNIRIFKVNGKKLQPWKEDL